MWREPDLSLSALLLYGRHFYHTCWTFSRSFCLLAPPPWCSVSRRQTCRLYANVPPRPLWVGQWEAPEGTWRVASTRGRVDGPGFLPPHCWGRAVPLGQRALIPRLVRWPLHTALLSRSWNRFLRQFPLLALGPRLVPGGKLS